MHLLKAMNDRRKVKSVSSPVKQAGADDWDKPYVHPVGPSNKKLVAASDAKKAARNTTTPMAPVTFSKTQAPAGHEYRLTSYGDD